ncbi:PQQ-binding-like beta-propeller repeat protein [Haloarcula onubensis]|uniref:PQQ-binding-like beta-propeller repeat protein n=1 Tax=Haloarcula onubensis TaxID=2950539 RepID=A0ABU2FJP3_9EURY|nr:PQQ-binding-like beta-propeller repeat protein [Halomicroarcula sp. S3CR25-11]MDS0280979.1 PQQ-binding-like beta-propeller repeat protein [Halomicroarcula sp. S3CR25-11]
MSEPDGRRRGSDRVVDRRGLLKLLALPVAATPLAALLVAGREDDDAVPNWLEYAASPRVRWVTEERYGAPPGVGDGRVYVGDPEGVVHALATADGSERWTVDTGLGREGSVLAAPTVAGDTVYVAARNGTLLALDPGGAERWGVETGGQVALAPVVSDDTVYVASGRTLLALDRSDGAERWRFDTGRDIALTGPPAVADGTVYVGSDETLSALSAADGTERWTRRSRGGLSSGPTVTGGTVYVGRGSDVHALSAADGTERWVTEDVSATERPAVADGRVYVTSLGGPLVALNAADGRVEWRFDAAEAMWTPPVVADGTVYVGAGDTDRVHAVDGADGSERWSFPAVGTPVVADGTVYVDAKTALFALRTD